MSWKRKLEKSWGRLGMKYKRYALSELAIIKYGKNQKKVLSEDGNIPIYGTGGLIGYGTTVLYYKPSVLIGRKGTIGKVKYVEHPFWTIDTLFYTIINTDIVTPKYLYYVMSLIDLNNYNEGTTIPSLRTETLNRLEFNIPSIEEQEIVLSCLNPIDEKIELNNAINNNLEEQAQAYFDKLFVVNADPNWPECTLSDIGSVIAGGTPSKSKPEYYADRGIAWITPKDLSVDKSKFISRGENDISELGFSKSSVTKMPAGTILFSSRAPIGYIAIAQNEVTTNQGFKSVIPNENIGTAYVYFLLKNLLPTIEGMASGSTFKEISGAAMKSVPTVIPDANTIRLFSNLCEPIFKEQEVLESENKHLSTLRDSLLQKLISGDIDVSDLVF